MGVAGRGLSSASAPRLVLASGPLEGLRGARGARGALGLRSRRLGRSGPDVAPSLRFAPLLPRPTHAELSAWAMKV